MMKLSCPLLFLAAALAGCVPTTQMREGEERARLTGLVRQFCAAERSSDPRELSALFVPSIRSMLDRRTSPPAAEPACEPGGAWYLGGSRMFAEVRRGGRSDRLDLWRGDWPLIRDVVYGKARRVGRRKVRSLREELIAELGPETAEAAPPSPPDDACGPAGYHFAFLATDTTVYRQGAVVRVTPMVDKSPAGTAELPLRCTSGWWVEGPATLDPQRTSLAIAPDAPVGATVTVRFRHAGKLIEKSLRVVARDEIVLTGSWSQRNLEGCWAEPVRELVFAPENRFAVTFNPFESYQDYWGRYAFDPATKRLKLTVEGGNFVPPHLDLDGEAELVEGRLRLTGLYLGSRDGSAQSGCTYLF